MNLEKAIEILTIELGAWPHKGTEDWYSAVALGIEAMRAVKHARKTGNWSWINELPGETKE